MLNKKSEESKTNSKELHNLCDKEENNKLFYPAPKKSTSIHKYGSKSTKGVSL